MRFAAHNTINEKTRSLLVSLLMVVLIFVCPLVLNGCWGDGGGGAELPAEEEPPVSPTTPTVVSLTDASGNALELDGSTGVFPTSFTLTFGQAMDEALMTAEDNIRMLCDVVGHADLTVEKADEEGKVYTVTVEDAYKYQLLECELIIGRDIVSAASSSTSASKALAEDISYTFTNACAVSDDFNADSQGCWEVVESWAEFGGEVDPDTYMWASWDEILGDDEVASFDPLGSALILDDTHNAIDEKRTFSIFKRVDISPDGFEVIMHFKRASGFTVPDGEHKVSDDNPDGFDWAWLFVGALEDTPGGPVADKYHILGIFAFGEKGESRQYCAAANMSIEGTVYYGIPCGSEEYYLRLKYTPESIQINYATYDVGDCEDCWIDLAQENNQLFPYPDIQWQADFPYIENVSGSGFIAFATQACEVVDDEFDPRPDEPHNNVVHIDSMVFEGFTVSGQY